MPTAATGGGEGRQGSAPGAEPEAGVGDASALAVRPGRCRLVPAAGPAEGGAEGLVRT